MKRSAMNKTFIAKDTLELPVEVRYTDGLEGPENPRLFCYGVEIPMEKLSYYEACAVEDIAREDWEAHMRDRLKPGIIDHLNDDL